MIVEARVVISGTRAAVWAAVADIENAAAIVRGIEKIEIVAKPARGLVGLRWRETRLLFGKLETVEKWITDAVENEFYKTRAEDGGFVFTSTISISASGGGTMLTSAHETTPQRLAARLMALPMILFRGTIRKALLQDLNDIKAAVERGSAA